MPEFADNTLKFSGQDLGKDVTLICVFQTPNAGTLYTDEFPICYKIIHLAAKGAVTAEIPLSASTAFFVPMPPSGNVVTPQIHQACVVGQQCEIQSSWPNGPTFITPTEGDAGYLGCINKDGNIGIGIGFVQSDKLSPCVLWTKNNRLTKVRPPSILNVYATTNHTAYMENEKISSDLPFSLIWSGDIFKLPPATTLKISIVSDIKVTH